MEMITHRRNGKTESIVDFMIMKRFRGNLILAAMVKALVIGGKI